jgi:hypothetical protein
LRNIDRYLHYVFLIFSPKNFCAVGFCFFKISRSVGGEAVGMPKRGTFSCPANYGSKEARKDKDRLHHFYCKRISLPSCGGRALSETEDAEEAQLTARVAAFEESPEGRARSRIFVLKLKSFSSSGLSDAETEGLESLRKGLP